jgi:eight-cysteine-cluster-containing protein
LKEKIFLAIAFVLVLFLAGCTQNNAPPTANPPNLPHTNNPIASPSPPANNQPPIQNPTAGKPQSYCLTDADCIRGGCSGQLVVSKYDEQTVTTCEWRPEYECAQKTKPACVNNKCIAQETPESKDCYAKLNLGTSSQTQNIASMPPAKDITIEADDSGFYPSGNIEISKGQTLNLTFKVRTENVYYGGLLIEADNKEFTTGNLAPGEKKTISIAPKQDISFTSYWPSSRRVKAHGKIIVK